MTERQNNTFTNFSLFIMKQYNNINLLLCIATHPPLPDPGTFKRMTHAKTHDYLWHKKFCQNIP